MEGKGEVARASSGNHAKYRTRMASSSNHAKYMMRTSYRSPQPFVLRKKPGKPSLPGKGPTRADFAQLLVAHTHTLPPLRATFGGHGTCTATLVRKKSGENPGMRRTYFRTPSGQGRFWARDFRLASIT